MLHSRRQGWVRHRLGCPGGGSVCCCLGWRVLCLLRRAGDGQPTGDVSRSCQGGVVFRSVEVSLDAGNGDRSLLASSLAILATKPAWWMLAIQRRGRPRWARQHTRRQRPLDPLARHLVERIPGYSVQFWRKCSWPFVTQPSRQQSVECVRSNVLTVEVVGLVVVLSSDDDWIVLDETIRTGSLVNVNWHPLDESIRPGTLSQCKLARTVIDESIRTDALVQCKLARTVIDESIRTDAIVQCNVAHVWWLNPHWWVDSNWRVRQCKDDTPSGSRARGWPSSQCGCVCVTCYVMSMRSPESDVICLIRWWSSKRSIPDTTSNLFIATSSASYNRLHIQCIAFAIRNYYTIKSRLWEPYIASGLLQNLYSLTSLKVAA